jgi:hypothetical protein
VRAPGAAQRGVPAGRAARTLPPGDAGELIVEGGGSGERRPPPEKWNPLPPSPRAVEQAPVAGAEAPAAGSSVEEPASAAEAPVSATVAPAGTTAVPPEPSRKIKRGFSNLR